MCCCIRKKKGGMKNMCKALPGNVYADIHVRPMYNKQDTEL